MAQRITRILEIDYGHRLLAHKGRCQNYHGHRGKFELVVEADELKDGMVVDFSDIKRVLGRWLDEHLDHAMILQVGDPLLYAMVPLGSGGTGAFGSAGIGGWDKLSGLKTHIIKDPPTAENIAKLVYERALDLLGPPLRIVKVVFWETPSCSAEYP